METSLRMSRAKGLTTASYYYTELPWGSKDVLDRLWPSAIKMQVRIAEATYRVLSRYLANIGQRVCRPCWTWPTLMRQLLVGLQLPILKSKCFLWLSPWLLCLKWPFVKMPLPHRVA